MSEEAGRREARREARKEASWSQGAREVEVRRTAALWWVGGGEAVRAVVRREEIWDWVEVSWGKAVGVGGGVVPLLRWRG